MSGYLEVKYPIKSNLGLNPFKSWKRQWCILRPSGTFSGGVLAVYCSEAGAAAGCVELPCGFVVRRAKSRSRPHAFAVFPPDEPRKPKILLAATSPHEAHIWMEKIKSLITASDVLDPILIKDSYSVTVLETELSRRVGLHGRDGTLSVTGAGLRLAAGAGTSLALCLEWRHVGNVALTADKGGPHCLVTVDGGSPYGGGRLQLSTPLAGEVARAVAAGRGGRARTTRALSRSEGDLSLTKDTGEVRRSWYSGPSEVSLDDLDLVMSKECVVLPRGKLSRCGGALALLTHTAQGSTASFDDSMSDRRSVASIASGIYEEIPDVPADRGLTSDRTSDRSLTSDRTTDRSLTLDRALTTARDTPDGPLPPLSDEYCIMTRDRTRTFIQGMQVCEEPMYEAVGEREDVPSLYGTVRRRRHAPAHPPPALPPRQYMSSWSVSRHGSVWPQEPRTLPRWDRSRQAFTAFRKRLKSDSRAAVSPKSETSKEKDVETKKKKFDFTPTRDIFKSFKVSRKMKNLKITSSNLSKGETKSCEFLDEQEHVSTKRCSKSVECLDSSEEFLDRLDTDLSMRFHDDSIQALSLPQEIVELIIKEKILINKEQAEGDYMPMSPIVPTPPMEHHYIVMSPRTNIA